MKRGISVVAVTCVLASAGLWAGASLVWANGYSPQVPVDTHATFSPIHDGDIGVPPTWLIETCSYTGGTSCLADYWLGAHSNDTSPSEVIAPESPVWAAEQRSRVWCGDPSDAPGCHYTASFSGIGHARVIGTAEKTENAGEVSSASSGTSGGYAAGGGASPQAWVGSSGLCTPSSFDWLVDGLVAAGTNGYYTIDSTSCGEDGSYGSYDVRSRWGITQTTPTRTLGKGGTTITVSSNCWCHPGTAMVSACGGPGQEWGEATCEIHCDSAMSASITIISTP